MGRVPLFNNLARQECDRTIGRVQLQQISKFNNIKALLMLDHRPKTIRDGQK